MVKNLPAKQETEVPSLGWEDPLEKEMATPVFLWLRITVHSSCTRVCSGAWPPCTQVCGLPSRMLKLGARGIWLVVRTEG